MSRKQQQRLKRAAQRKQKLQQAAQRRALVAQINLLVQPYGCRVTGLGAPAVGVQGDARTYGLSVVLRYDDFERMMEVSTLVTNRVREVTRVLMDIPLESRP